MTPKEINLKIAYYVKLKLEKEYYELSCMCFMVNVHLSKKNQVDAKKIYDKMNKAKRIEEEKAKMTPEEKAEMLKGMFSGGARDTDDFVAQKKAQRAIAELKRQGKLK